MEIVITFDKLQSNICKAAWAHHVFKNMLAVQTGEVLNAELRGTQCTLNRNHENIEKHS